jgi:hypothetical protein
VFITGETAHAELEMDDGTVRDIILGIAIEDRENVRELMQEIVSLKGQRDLLLNKLCELAPKPKKAKAKKARKRIEFLEDEAVAK